MIIKAQNLVIHSKSREILNINDFSIQTGKINILLGPNGAGKSTLMRAIMGFTKNISGEILIDDKNILSLTPLKRAQYIGYLAQNVKIEWDMNVLDLISLGRLPYGFSGIYDGDADKKAINDAIEMLEIGHLINCNINEISGGELALCLLARVFAGTPKFILIDEPLNHLDIAHQLQLMKAIKKFAQNGGGVLAILHDLNQALQIGDEFTLLKNGRILANGNKEKVLSPTNIMDAYGIKAKIHDFDGEKLFQFS